ncbi:mannitol dehydrogenase family protein [Ochrobactrum sp. CM-21-5]|nr:mannitol dehydrogenase family protein [Ochrobactrum sp. CM-21-5]MBC2886568.1 mannitol dehydrogenase family protein [Ochrobactrum sp. CM-21-5]
MQTPERLCLHSLPSLPTDVLRPGYARNALTTGIVHLGIGAFHRAHQAVYTDTVLENGASDWGIAGVSLRSADTRDALKPQDGLYTLAVRDGQGDRLRVIGSVTDVFVAPESPEAVLELMSRETTRIVSLTITEKGYCYAPASASLDEKHPDIIHDLSNRSEPRSAPGFIVESLRRRRDAGIAPFTLLSCDNLPTNGTTLKRVVVHFAELCDAKLAGFIEEYVAFPSTMVDRIVPATTNDDRRMIAVATGFQDNWPVMTEPFSQWVIEDHFPTGRPTWESAGAIFVEDVSAFELMKLRLLNGSHSTLAYLGFLAGYETVSDVMKAPGFTEFVRAMMDEEISPTLPRLPGFDLVNYKDQLIDRFQNPALRHRTAQIAMDGSQKLPQRLLNTIRERLERKEGVERLALGVAGWMRYATGRDESGKAIDVHDPMAHEIWARVAGKTSAKDLAYAYLGLKNIFGDDLPHSEHFRSQVTAALDQLLVCGSAKSVEMVK